MGSEPLTVVCLLGSAVARSPRDTGPVIRDVDDSLVSWLGEMVPTVPVELGPPADPEARTRKGAASIALFLHEVREDADGSAAGWSELRNDEGRLVGRMPPSRRYRLTYLVFATAQDVRTEHDLLGRVLAGSALTEVVPPEHLAGSLADVEATMIVRCAPARGHADPSELWAAWRLAPRTTLELSVLAPLPLSYVAEVAEPPSSVDLRVRRGAADPAAPTAPRPAPRRPRVHEVR